MFLKSLAIEEEKRNENDLMSIENILSQTDFTRKQTDFYNKEPSLWKMSVKTSN